MDQRTKIFIGHANPEDNDFTLWLNAKLQNEGYDVICDLTFLIGGEEDYWKSLQNVLEKGCLKYLLVLSKTTFTKQGVIDEWEQVRGISKKYNLTDFIYILKIDDVPFDVRIGTKVYNQFRFDESWAQGLKKLIIKLFKDNVPKNEKLSLTINDWLKNKFSTNTGILKKDETFYSNWLGIDNYPTNIYLFRYSIAAQAKAIAEEITSYPAIQHDKYIVSFLNDLPKHYKKNDLTIAYKEKVDIPLTDIFDNIERTEFPKLGDLKRFTVRLFNDAFVKFLENRGLPFHFMSQNRKCYYYIKDQIFNDKIHFEYEGKRTWKQILGEYYDNYWHFGISVNCLLSPIFSYSIKTHILFTDEGKTIWDNKSKLHKARRAKGKSFFNKDWRSLLLAFLKTLSDDSIHIIVPLNETFTLKLNATPITFLSNVGYDEPHNKGRLVPIDYYEENEMEYSDEEIIDKVD
jgi:hypothetical protein